MAYGLVIKDAAGNELRITPDMVNVVASGQVTMPNSLVETNKYFVSIDLPGAAAIPINDVGCIANAFLLNVGLYAAYLNSDGAYYCSFFADAGYSHYTKNLTTGVMSSWTPGNHANVNDANAWDHISSVYPMIYWDKLGLSTVTAVKIFATMRYFVFDASVGPYGEHKIVHQIGNQGVERADYAIVMRRKEVE